VDYVPYRSELLNSIVVLCLVVLAILPYNFVCVQLHVPYAKVVDKFAVFKPCVSRFQVSAEVLFLDSSFFRRAIRWRKKEESSIRVLIRGEVGEGPAKL
jgi:hypothetical protein